MRNRHSTTEADRALILRRGVPAILLLLVLGTLGCTGKHAAGATPASVPSNTVDRAPTERRVVAFTKPPKILNNEEIVRAMARNYPPGLRDRGIGGTVMLRVFVDEHGIVRGRQIYRSSGNKRLDAAALEVVAIYRFSPALNRDEPVPAWITFPVTFAVHRRDP